jgi:hypothetical protein
MNTRKLRSCELDAALADVTVANVALGARVRRGRTWNRAWRDDIDTGSAACPRPRLTGTVVGYTDTGGKLVGENSGRQFDTDRVTESSGPGWVVVEWDPTSPSCAGKRSVYPVGAMGVHSLAFAQLDTVGAVGTGVVGACAADTGTVGVMDVGELYRSNDSFSQKVYLYDVCHRT